MPPHPENRERPIRSVGSILIIFIVIEILVVVYWGAIESKNGDGR